MEEIKIEKIARAKAEAAQAELARAGKKKKRRKAGARAKQGDEEVKQARDDPEGVQVVTIQDVNSDDEPVAK